MSSTVYGWGGSPKRVAPQVLAESRMGGADGFGNHLGIWLPSRSCFDANNGPGWKHLNRFLIKGCLLSP